MDNRQHEQNMPYGQATAAVASGLTQWEIDEDHLLSYFLDPEVSGETETLPEGQVANNGIAASSSRSQPSSSNALGRLSQNQTGLSHNNYGGASGTSSSGGQLRVHFSDESLAAHQARQGGLPAYYPPIARQTSQQRRFSTSSMQSSSNGSLHKVPSTPSTERSSNSSLTNLAAALALGAPPNQVMIMQQQLQAREESKANGTSEYQLPITPLSMMSPKSQEFMMLPPPPRFPGSVMSAQSNVFQQHPHPQQHQTAQQIHQEQQQQPVPHPSWNHQVNGTSFTGTTQQTVQLQQPPNHNQFPQTPHAGFPDPNSVSGAVLSQTPQPQAPQQIHIGVNGQTIPVTAVPGSNGSIFYQIDPNVAASANLRYFTKAINEVSKPVEQKEDPAVLAEKRQRRLARNRESARNSRRRKKERLVNLGAKVNELQSKLEADIRQKIVSMEAGLSRKRSAQIQRWIESGGHSNDEFRDILQSTGVNIPIRRSVIAHQYEFLRQAFFSSHSQFSVWLMRQPQSYLTASNHLKPMPLPDKDPTKKSTAGTRANSKLVGEKLFVDEKEKNDGKGVSCQANDQLFLWPLYCYEIGMTMEQEDRIVNQAHKEFDEVPDFESKLHQMHTSKSVTNQMQNTMLCLSQLSSQRQETLLDILTPAQMVTLIEWTKKNKQRARSTMERQVNAGMRRTSLENALQKLEGVRLRMNSTTPP